MNLEVVVGTSGITENEVFDIIEVLVSEKIEPTIKLIRERLGSGSFATISKHLNTWREKSEKKLPEMPEAMLKVAQYYWGHAYKAAEAVLSSEREKLKEEIVQWVKERESFISEIEKLEVSKHSEERRNKDILAELERERKVQVQRDESFMKLSQQYSKLEAKFESLSERFAEEKARSVRLEKDLAEIAKKKK
jgi:chromosome segregation ATPase